MRSVCTLVALSMLMLLGCQAATSTVADSKTEAPRNTSITGEGVQLVKLDLPGMT